MAYAFAPSAPSLSWTTGTACARCPAIRLRHELPRNVRVSARPMQRSKTPQMGLIPFIPNWLALGAWFFGAYRFYLGFDSTSYQKSYRLPLSFAWPLFMIFNGSYRKNFFKAIKGSDD